MRKVILDLTLTLDGYIEGPNGEIDWIAADGHTDFADVLIDILDGIDAIFYGRVSYELWGNYRPDTDASPKLQKAYDLLHSKTKYVFSTTLQQPKNENVIVISSDIEATVNKILNETGGNIWLYGGGKLTTTFVNLDLIDIYRLAFQPVILGEGKPLFENIKNRVGLKLLSSKAGGDGVVMLRYAKVSA
ncbi:MAG TPA: dihydrofolate reductase family protein [Pedobacter sp.]|nr:dihydrofolate reductase family protein [Pedobacter sp.]